MTPKQVLQELGVEVAPEGHHHCTESWIQVDCPSCTPGARRFRLGLRFPTAASCYVCGPSRLWAEALPAITGKTPRELREAFSGCDFGTPRQSRQDRVYGVFRPPRGICPLSRPFRLYCRARGLSVAMLRDVYGVRGIGPAGGDLAWRLYIPVRIGMEPVSWTTRSIDDDNPRRYWSARPDQEKVPHKSLLFGMELARHAIAVNEGPLDAMALGPGGVATFGVNYTEAQLVKMTQFPVRVVVADNEPDAIRRAEKLVAELEVYPGKTVLFIPSGKDLLSSPPREREWLRRRYLR